MKLPQTTGKLPHSAEKLPQSARKTRRVAHKAAAAAGLAITATVLMAQYGGVDLWWEAGSARPLPMFAQFQDSTGDLMVVNMEAPVATRNHPFFEDMGVNGRACVTCHQPSSAMGLAAERVRQQFDDTRGRDPVFAAVDGSNCPTLPQLERSSHSLLLQRGLFRIFLPIRKSAEFTIEVVRDPTGCNTDETYGLGSANPTISVFRRPRVVGNLKYVVGSGAAFQSGTQGTAGLAADGRHATLEQQAIEAMHTHEQAGRALSSEEMQQILDFESQVFVAQVADKEGGDLTEMNGPLGAWSLGFNKQPAGTSNAPVFLEANYWKSASSGRAGRTAQTEFRESVARGNAIFTTREFDVSHVANLAESHTGAKGTCATCHTAPGTGSNLKQQAMDVGTTVYADAAMAPRDLPLFKVTCTAGTHPYLGRTIYTTDPGRALTSGKCADVGSIVTQQLRGLAARAPYFSNGSAKTLAEVVSYYDVRFAMRLSQGEKQDLVNFLSAL